MKRLICPKCKKVQGQGKFCLDCGCALKEVVTADTKFKKFSTARGITTLKMNVRNWLTRIGVQQSDIQISTDSFSAQINYTLKGKRYTFGSDLQDNEANNLAAIEHFLHGRVLGIERGIETEEQAFAGYLALPDYSGKKEPLPYETLGFDHPVDYATANKKFKQLSKKFHPDVNDSPEANRQFVQMKKALDSIERMAR